MSARASLVGSTITSTSFFDDQHGADVDLLPLAPPFDITFPTIGSSATQTFINVPAGNIPVFEVTTTLLNPDTVEISIHNLTGSPFNLNEVEGDTDGDFNSDDVDFPDRAKSPVNPGALPPYYWAG